MFNQNMLPLMAKNKHKSLILHISEFQIMYFLYIYFLSHQYFNFL